MSEARIVSCSFPGGFSVALDSPALVSGGFLHLFRAFMSEARVAGPSLQVQVEECQDAQWSVRVDGIRAVSFESRDLIPPFLETLVCQFLIHQRADRIPIHASGVARKGAAVLMPGEKGSGKSTLALLLSTRGFEYLGDEILWIDPATAAVEPFPKAAAIKAGAFELFDRAPEFQSPTRGPLRYFLPALPLQNEYPVERIIFPQFNRDEPGGIYPLQPEETLLYLSRMLFGGLARRPERFPALLQLAEKPACLAVYRDAREIEAYLRAEAASP